MELSWYPLILVKSLQCTWGSGTHRFNYGYPSSCELQWLDSMIGYHYSRSIDSHQLSYPINIIESFKSYSVFSLFITVSLISISCVYVLVPVSVQKAVSLSCVSLIFSPRSLWSLWWTQPILLQRGGRGLPAAGDHRAECHHCHEGQVGQFTDGP